MSVWQIFSPFTPYEVVEHTNTDNTCSCASTVLTTYESVNRAIQYHVDRVPGLIASSIPLIMPTSHADMIKLFRSHLQSLPRHEGQRVVAVIDGCSSNPGIVFPWVEMVQVCKEENVFSLVDAAHGIGLVEVDLNKVSPDAWVSVCTKPSYLPVRFVILVDVFSGGRTAINGCSVSVARQPCTFP